MMQCQKTHAFSLLPLLCFMLFCQSISNRIIVAAAEDEDDGKISVLVGFESKEATQQFATACRDPVVAATASARTFSTASSSGPQIEHEYENADALALRVTREEYEEMKLSNAFAYVEEDPTVFQMEIPSQKDRRRHLQSGEEPSYGLFSVQGDLDIPLPPSDSQDCLVDICIIDSGLIEGHFDIPYKRGDGYLDGEEFGLPNGQFWWNALPDGDHGTGVAGVIVAEGGNNRGTVGVIPNGPKDSKVCLSIARVFADGDSSTPTSRILTAVEWCGRRHSNGSGKHMVVNLSLGTSSHTILEQKIYRELYNQGVLFMAAAGNAGNELFSYPASWNEVVSVASVDEGNAHSSFSQENDQVELAAPGRRIISPGGGGSGSGLELNVEGAIVQASFMQNNNYPSDFNFEQSFKMVDCGFGFEPCKNANGKVCIMQRDGTFTFRDKVQNCQAGGGIIAIVYNNQEGTFTGLIGDPNTVNIPALSMIESAGNFLKQNIDRSFTATNVIGSVRYYTGTSFSAPYATGVAAKIWASRPACTNAQIREALRETTFKLGNRIPNDQTGYGLIQAQSAYDYLVNNLDPPCGGEAQTDVTIEPPTSNPTQKPTKAPTPQPTVPPTPQPTVPPTPQPTVPPTPQPTVPPTPQPTVPPTPQPTVPPTPSPTPGPTSICVAQLEACAQTDECCSGLECRRISVDSTQPWACRPKQTESKQESKLPRAGYCIGGVVGPGCRRRTSATRERKPGRGLRGEHSALAHAHRSELEETDDGESKEKNDSNVPTSEDTREQRPEEKKVLPEA